MSVFTDRLEHEVGHLRQSQAAANKMVEHATRCIEEACAINSRLDWRRNGSSTLLFARLRLGEWLAGSGGSRKVLTVHALDACPGHIRVICHSAYLDDVFTNCDNLLAVDKHICKAICQYLARTPQEKE